VPDCLQNSTQLAAISRQLIMESTYDNDQPQLSPGLLSVALSGVTGSQAALVEFDTQK